MDPSDANQDSGYVRQVRFWNEMVQLKAHLYYLSYHRRAADRIDFWIKCLTAVASSSSIAGWAIWHEHGFFWAIVIAGSQLINAVKHYLPFESRRKATNDAYNELENVFIQAESDWYYVSEGHLTDEEIHSKMIAMKKEKAEVVRRYMSLLVIPRNADFERRAADDVQRYFQTLYFDGASND